jgi:hypothetical protein
VILWLLALSKMLMMVINGLLQGFMALMRIRIGAFYGMSWLV